MSNHCRPVNAFPVGNQYYKLAAYTGRPKKFETPEDLWSAALLYFDWCVTNPVIDSVVAGETPKVLDVPKMRAMSLPALCSHIGVCNLRYYKTLADFSPVISLIKTVMYDYNLSGAVSGLLNPCVVARQLVNAAV